MQQLPGGPDKRVAFEILAVAGFFTDQHQARASRAFAKDRLRRIFVEIAATARRGCVA